MQLFKKYAPQSFGEVVAQDKVVQRIERLNNTSGLGGRAYLLSGQSGTGKTSIVNIAARELCDEHAIDEMDASGLTPSAVVEIERSVKTLGMVKRGRAVIVNEVHGLRKDTIRQLLVTLERIPPHVAWFFTTTNEGQASLFEDCDDATPLVSRCVRFDLARTGLAEPFAKHAHAIAEREGLTDKPVAKFIRLAKDCRNNLRMMLSHVESGAMLG